MPRSIVAPCALWIALVPAAAALAGDNLLANGEFDDGLHGWSVEFPEVHLSGADAGFSPDSGSMQIDHPAAADSGVAFTGRQCVAVTGGGAYEAAVLAALLGPDHPRGAVYLELAWHATAECAGEPIEVSRLAESDLRYWFWLLLTGAATAPEAAQSARVMLGLEKLESGDWTLQSLFDRAYFGAVTEGAAVAGERVANGDFDAGTAGWSHGPDVVWSAADAAGNPASGALESRDAGGGPEGRVEAEQCFALGAGNYDFHAEYRLLGESPAASAVAELELFAQSDCAEASRLESRVLAVGTARSGWAALRAGDVAIPAEAGSGRLRLATIRSGGGELVGRYDRVSFASSGADGDCVPAADALCLRGRRFRVTATWATGDGTSGAGTAVSLSDDTGYFWFFDAANVEAVVKVLDGCGINDRYWVYAGGLTDLGVSLLVEDTRTGATAQYGNALGRPFETITDAAALDACP